MEAVRGIVGDKWVYTDPWMLIGYERDYWPLIVALEAYKGLELGRPAAAIAPGSEDEVALVVEEAVRHGVKLIPYSGGTGVLGGVIGEGEWVALDLGRLRWIKWHDEEGGLVDVGAGALLVEVEEWLNNRGWTLRHIPQSYPTAMIGGLIATRSTGQYSTGYGGIEERIKGIRVVVPGYGLVDVRPAPRRSLLVPLEQLFTGSEGLLGVITGAYLEAFRVPECSRPVSWVLDSFSEALDAAKILVQSRIAPELFRVYDEMESGIYFNSTGSVVLGVVEGKCSIVEERVRVMNRLMGEPEPTYAEKWLRERFNVIGPVREAFNAGYAFETIEVSASWGRLKGVYKAVLDRASSIEGVYVVGAHAGHFYPSGAALYYTFLLDLGRVEDVYWSLWDNVMRAVHEKGGSIGHHHGVGRVRSRWLNLEYGQAGSDLIRRLKECLDPRGILRGGLDG